jgi:hypothetical protein
MDIDGQGQVDTGLGKMSVGGSDIYSDVCSVRSGRPDMSSMSLVK